MPITEC